MQQFLSRLFVRLMKSWNWVMLIVLTILIKWASWHPDWVEKNYSNGIFPFISKIQRLAFGWVPFSVGDIFYGFLVLIILYKTYSLLKTMVSKKFNRQYFITGLQQMIFFFLFIYVFFNILWGLNYNRKGLAQQLGLDIKRFSTKDLDTLALSLQNRLSFYAPFVTEEQRDSFNRKKTLFDHAANAYKAAAGHYSFLKYHHRSVKPSLFSYLGNYLGFQGYYNPFSGEGQVNTTVPRFLEPFIATHEIAHQLGYAKENEANFTGYLACKSYNNNAFRYSVYFDMYNYTIGELYLQDSARAKELLEKLHPQVKKDRKEMLDFFLRYKNPVEQVIAWGYGQYLKANNQPGGKKSYNEVVAWLIAYYKKFGTDAL